jgi:MoxR-like ATPase
MSTDTLSDDWHLFRAADARRADEGLNKERLAALPDPPPWRRFEGLARERAQSFLPDRDDIERVNAALYLRRPLLITGKPGTGKTTLVYAVARALGLGQVLRWSITSRSTLQDGLYQYDAVARLQDTHLDRPGQGEGQPKGGSPKATGSNEVDSLDIGRYLTLGPLGTAFFANGPVKIEGRERWFPRVLLIDEIDKSDIDLPNDLLHVFEEGRFEIPELVRLKNRQPQVQVRAWGKDAGMLPVEHGEVPCREFPLVVMTSNGERDFPPAFLRRCLQLDIQPPGRAKLEQIVRAHLFPSGHGADQREAAEQEYDRHREVIDKLIKRFLDLRDSDRKELATDQLLNAVSLAMSGVDLAKLLDAGPGDDGTAAAAATDGDGGANLLDTLYRPLSNG